MVARSLKRDGDGSAVSRVCKESLGTERKPLLTSEVPDYLCHVTGSDFFELDGEHYTFM